MGSRGGTSGKASSRLVCAACLALCLLLSRCSPCEGRKLLLLAAGEEGGRKVMGVDGDLVLRVPPASPVTGSGFSAGGRAARLMRSVPSPGVGH
jgi:hypothetical protein